MEGFKKFLKVILIIILLIILAVIFIYARIFINYKMNEEKYNASHPIQGNTNGYVPQGLEYSTKYNIVLQTSYNANNEASMLYVTDFESGKLLKSLKLMKEDDSPNTNHVGGITTNEDKVWITNDYEISEYNLEEIYTTNNNSIKSMKTTELPVRGDFCKYKNTTLWIGDFYLKHFYDVPDDNPLLMAYDVKEEMNFNEPKYIMSLPKMVQGMEITKENEFIFTESFTYLINSKLQVYTNPFNARPSTYKFNDKDIPYYEFGKTNLRKTIKIPPMAEGMFYKDKSLYILFESNSDKYKFAYPKVENVIKFVDSNWK